jgi:hypothetical protein
MLIGRNINAKEKVMTRATLPIVAAILITGCAEVPANPSRLESAGPSQLDATQGGGVATLSRIDTSLGHGGAELSATLTGAAEVPGPGDPDGSGMVRITLNPGAGEVCFNLEVSNIEAATASHIHPGGPTVAGPPVVTLAPPPSAGSSTACVSADRELVLAIRKNPSEYYVNVHNAEFPGGAIRGQLAP